MEDFCAGAEVGEDPQEEEANWTWWTHRQLAVGDQLTTDWGDLLSVSDRQEWWLGSTANKCAIRRRRLITLRM